MQRRTTFRLAGGMVAANLSGLLLITNAVPAAAGTDITWSTARLSQARHWIGATSVAGKAIFAGGRPSGSPPRFPISNPIDDRQDCSSTSQGSPTRTGTFHPIIVVV